MDYLPNDPAILVSSVNMLLRDEEFDSLESLCYADMSRKLYDALSGGEADFLRDHKRFQEDITKAVEQLEEML